MAIVETTAAHGGWPPSCPMPTPLPRRQRSRHTGCIRAHFTAPIRGGKCDGVCCCCIIRARGPQLKSQWNMGSPGEHGAMHFWGSDPMMGPTVGVQRRLRARNTGSCEPLPAHRHGEQTSWLCESRPSTPASGWTRRAQRRIAAGSCELLPEKTTRISTSDARKGIPACAVSGA